MTASQYDHVVERGLLGDREVGPGFMELPEITQSNKERRGNKWQKCVG